MTEGSTPGALPFYKSPVYLAIMVSIITHLAAYFPKIADFFGVSIANIPVLATDALQFIGLAALFVAERFRANSKVQQLTLTQSSATKVSDAKIQAVPIPASTPPAGSSGLS
jgi:hypothetical protein